MLLIKFFYKYILRRKYYRFGKCNRCGDCCSKIYVKHNNGVITCEEEFNKLKKLHPFYAGLEIIDKDKQGLVFKCNKFDKDKKICTIHKFRSSICRKYPSEEIFKFHGVMSDKCGYYFKPIDTFKEILEKEQKKLK
ncbi:YkgJ family cysteine cluster protein [bacterium]|nr:YkgJ family cysteine cluster protein [bacterium]